MCRIVEILDIKPATNNSQSRKRPRSPAPNSNDFTTASQAIIIQEDSSDESEIASSPKRIKKNKLFDTEAWRSNYRAHMEAVETKYDSCKTEPIEGYLPTVSGPENSVSLSQHAKISELPDAEAESTDHKSTGNNDVMDVSSMEHQVSPQEPLLTHTICDAETSSKDISSASPSHQMTSDSPVPLNEETQKSVDPKPQIDNPAPARKIYKAKRRNISVNTVCKATAFTVGALATVAAGAAYFAPDATNQFVADYVAPSVHSGISKALECTSYLQATFPTLSKFGASMFSASEQS